MDYARAMTDTLEQHKLPLRTDRDLDPLLESIGDKRFVFLGEASHGTHEFYTWRAHITKRLIEEKGFNFVAVEGDWPDCFELNRYIKGFKDAAKHPSDVMKTYFKRWPVWMWGNWEVAALAGWMRQHNLKKTGSLQERVGFYGLDVYSLLESLEAILAYMRDVDGEEAIQTAERALACFERVAVMGKEDVGQAYGMAATLTPYSCRNEVVELLVKVRQEAAKLAGKPHDEEAAEYNLSAELNTKVVLDAEKYYRIMIGGSDDSWNARDSHMHDTLQRLTQFHGPDSKAIIWAHNTHNGDARATDMAVGGMHNIGQLAREKWGKDQVHLVGFGTYQGTVMAGERWGAEMKIMRLPPGRPGTWEDVCHKAGKGEDMIVLPSVLQQPVFEKRIGHHAVGVVYNPLRDSGQYVPSVLRARYDAFVFVDTTQAVHALKLKADPTEVPETYPWGV